MKITQIDSFDYHDNNDLNQGPTDGLGEINFNPSKRIVAIAGKNGAGKSRLLSRVGSVIGRTYGFLLPRGIPEVQVELQAQPGRSELRQKLAYMQWLEQKNDQEQSSGHPFDEASTIGEGVKRATFLIPKQTQLSSASGFNQDQQNNHIENINFAEGLLTTHQGCLSHINQVCNNYLSSDSNKTTLTEAERTEKALRFDQLNDLVSRLLGAELEVKGFNEVHLFGLDLNELKLSEGQSVLLQCCVILHKLGGEIKNEILLLDEPENHLHPAALIELVKNLDELVTDGQLWIATHSIPLLSYLYQHEEADLFFMEDGKIQFAGKTPELVLESLLGDEQQRSQMADFLYSPAYYAMTNFSIQCLSAPGVSAHQEKDSQEAQASTTHQSRAGVGLWGWQRQAVGRDGRFLWQRATTKRHGLCGF